MALIYCLIGGSLPWVFFYYLRASQLFSSLMSHFVNEITENSKGRGPPVQLVTSSRV